MAPGWDQLALTEQARLLARQGQSNVVADRVRVVDEAMHDVPRDGMTMGEVLGKVQKYALREKEWAGHDKRIS